MFPLASASVTFHQVAGVSTIDIVQAPAVEVAAPMNGVTVDQANAPKFQEAFIEGVAAQVDRALSNPGPYLRPI